MICSGCGIGVVVVGSPDFVGDTSKDGCTCHYEPVDRHLADVVTKYKIPFYCEMCGAIKLPIQAHNNYVILWEPTPEKIGSILIPEKVRKVFLKGIGVILSSGKGASDKRKFIPNETKPGDVVYYDKSVPWFVEIYGVDGKLYEVPIMPEQDIKCMVGDEETSDEGQGDSQGVNTESNSQEVASS